MKKWATAPAFKLKDWTGKTYSWNDFKTDYIVLYFYPKDDTAGCAIEAKEFTKNLTKFEKLGATVVGISGGTEKTKKAFCTKYSIKQTLLTDPTYSIAKKFGAFGKKKFMGRTYEGILRNTYLLDKAGKLIETFENVKPETHWNELLTYITGLKTGKKATTAKTTATTLKPLKKTTAKLAAKTAKPTVKAAAKGKSIVAKKATPTLGLTKKKAKTLGKTTRTAKTTAKTAAPSRAKTKRTSR